jgi:hypothetical protein
MSEKYISFSPVFSGLCNVIMSYEMAFSIAHITKRKIILPPKTWLLFISESQNLNDFTDIWSIFDKELVKKEFDCIEFEDVPEFKNLYNQIKSEKSFTGNISKYIYDLGNINFLEEGRTTSISSKHTVLTCGKYDSEDYRNFKGDRDSYDLNRPEKFLHFEDNLFGHFWYHVYPGDSKERDILKQKINKCFRYHERFYQMAEKVKEKIGNYNAIHIRRGDFLFARPESLEPVNNSFKILEILKNLLCTKTPLYISTDETDIKFFHPIGNVYNCYFYDEFEFDLNELDKAVLEQVICENSLEFYGSWLSTYTKRINVMRGCSNKQASDWMAINYNPSLDEVKSMYTEDALPWIRREDKLWYWSMSYHPQWTMET